MGGHPWKPKKGGGGCGERSAERGEQDRKRTKKGQDMFRDLEEKSGAHDRR